MEQEVIKAGREEIGDCGGGRVVVGGLEVKGAGKGGNQENEKEGRDGRKAVMAQSCANCS